MSETKIRIFVSSPGDVGQERVMTKSVIERLQGEFAAYAKLEIVMWEHEPLRATEHFQNQIILPSSSDIVVCILWSRLGTRLPENFKKQDGSAYTSGTEWEFEDAAKAYRERKVPDLLVYRKMEEPPISIGSKNSMFSLKQKEALDSFIEYWFGSPEKGFTAAFHTFNTLNEFEEKLEIHLRKLIIDKIPVHVHSDNISVTWLRGSPFLGLKSFDYEHSSVFFGRVGEVGKIKDNLQFQTSKGCAFILILGKSGCGKSSLIKAGVLPYITQPGVVEGIEYWRHCIFRPGSTKGSLVESFILSMFQDTGFTKTLLDKYEIKNLISEVKDDTAKILDCIKVILKEVAEQEKIEKGLLRIPKTKFAVVIDQMEEIFTSPNFSEEDRNRFISIVQLMATSGFIWIIASMRNDFYDRCMLVPEIVKMKEGKGQYDLLPPNIIQFGQMIRNPAKAAGIRFERDIENGQYLDEVILQTAAKNPDSLPLMEFVLEELYKKRTESNILTFDAYKELGGLEGALSVRAEEVMSQMNQEVQKSFKNIFKRLITIDYDNDRVLSANCISYKAVASSENDQAFIDAFLNARLFSIDKTHEGEAVVGISHEALLYNWPRLTSFIEENREFFMIISKVKVSKARWMQENKNVDYLLPDGKQLSEAEYVLKLGRNDIDIELENYINESIKKVKQSRRIKRFSIAAAFMIISALAVLSYFQMNKAILQRDASLKNESLFIAEISKRQTASGDAEIGLMLAKEALPKNVANPDRPYSADAEEALYKAIYENNEKVVLSNVVDSDVAVFSPDGKYIVSTTAKGEILIYDGITKEFIRKISAHSDIIRDFDFSSDSSLMVTGSQDKTIKVWEISSGKLIHSLDVSDMVERVKFNSKNKEIIAEVGFKEIIILDIVNYQITKRLNGQASKGYYSLPYSNSDISYIISDNSQEEFDVVECASGKKIGAIKKEKGNIGPTFGYYGFQVSPDGNYIARYSPIYEDIYLWNIKENRCITLTGHSDGINSLQFSNDSKLILTASKDKTAALWDVGTGKKIVSYEGHTDVVNYARFSPDESRISTCSKDSSMKVWDTFTGKNLQNFKSGEEVMKNSFFSPDGKHLISTSGENIFIWRCGDNSDKTILNETKTPDGMGYTIGFPIDNGKLVLSTNGKYIHKWDVENKKIISEVSAEVAGIYNLQCSNNGKYAVSQDYNKFIIWDIATMKPIVTRNEGTYCSFSLKGDKVAISSSEYFEVFDITDEKTLFKTYGVKLTNSPYFSEDGKYVVADTYVFDASTGKKLVELDNIEGLEPFSHFEISSNGKYIAASLGNDKAAIWDFESGRLIKVFSDNSQLTCNANIIRFSPNGKVLIQGTADGLIHLWDIESGKEIGELEGHCSEITAIEFNHAKTRFVTASQEGTMYMWDAETFERIAVMDEHKLSSIKYAANEGFKYNIRATFSADDSYVVTSSENGEIVIWNTYPTTQKLLDHANVLNKNLLTSEQKKSLFTY